MKNKKGTLELGVILLLVAGIAFGHLQYKAGEWGANGVAKQQWEKIKEAHYSDITEDELFIPNTTDLREVIGE